jgi:hypothetical protein
MIYLSLPQKNVSVVFANHAQGCYSTYVSSPPVPFFCGKKSSKPGGFLFGGER